MKQPVDAELITSLRARHAEALKQLRQARKAGDRAQAKAWATAFKHISTLREDAGDDPNAPL